MTTLILYLVIGAQMTTIRTAHPDMPSCQKALAEIKAHPAPAWLDLKHAECKARKAPRGDA